MLDKIRLFRVSWTLFDQAVVSLGAFALNVQLARNLPVTEYGGFALLLSSFLVLQLFNSSLLFHQLSVRLVVAESERRSVLLTTTAILSVGSTLLLGALLALGLAIANQSDILVPAVASFVLWQFQEGARRGLLAAFRHKTAIAGDAINYLGQAGVVTALVLTHSLTLANALYGMAAMSAIAAIVQLLQLGLSFRGPRELRRVANDCWSIGKWVLAYNLVSLLRLQTFPWVLAATSGPKAAAWFQAALNVANLANPIVIGLCNVIPQTAAQQQAKGLATSWKAARVYALMGMPLTFGYYLVALALPGLALTIFYGAGSPYVDLSLAVRLLVCAMMFNYWADLIASFLNGVNAARTALTINLAASATAIILGFVLIGPLGLIGCCLAAVGANAVRVAVSFRTLARFVAEKPGSTGARATFSIGKPALVGVEVRTKEMRP